MDEGLNQSSSVAEYSSMETSQNQLFERFFNCLISGDRPGARMVVDQVLDAAACDGQKVLTHL